MPGEGRATVAVPATVPNGRAGRRGKTRVSERVFVLGRLDIVKRVLDMTRASSGSVGPCAWRTDRRSWTTFGGMLEASAVAVRRVLPGSRGGARRGGLRAGAGE